MEIRVILVPTNKPSLFIKLKLSFVVPLNNSNSIFLILLSWIFQIPVDPRYYVKM